MNQETIKRKIMALSDGNVGTIKILLEVVIYDPLLLDTLSDLNLTGDQIYMLYNDCFTLPDKMKKFLKYLYLYETRVISQGYVQENVVDVEYCTSIDMKKYFNYDIVRFNDIWCAVDKDSYIDEKNCYRFRSKVGVGIISEREYREGLFPFFSFDNIKYWS